MASHETNLPPIRIGIGYDSHRLGDGGPLRIGGVDLPHAKHLIGHSDADVLLHAITDALLGSIKGGDIGRLFPNDDPTHAGRDSADFLREAARRVAAAGFSLGNLDCVVLAQKPKLSPFIDQIERRIADILGADPAQVGVKAKTGEGVGPVGREEAIEARCTALVVTRSLRADADAGL